jgi:hypothetical protein
VATPNPAVPGQDVVVSAARSISPVGDALTYEWSVDGAPFVAGSATRPPESFPVGAHTFTVRVTDAHTRSTQASTTVKVTAPPTTNLTAMPADPQSGETITLDSASADAGGSVVQHEWDLDGNGTYERSTDAVRTLETKFATPGAHTVGVRVTDNDGATSTQSLVITVRTLPPMATFTVSPAPPVVGSTATLSALGSLDLDGRIARYEWDLDGDGTYETNGASAPTVQHVFTAAGPIAVRLRVTDDSGAQAEKTVSVSPNRAPVAAVTAAPNPVVAGRPVTFDAGGSLDPDGTVARFQWDLDGDGIFELDTATTPTTARAYPNAGAVTVRVRVTDDAGTPAMGTVEVVVRPVPEPTGGSGGSTAPADGGGTAPAPAAPGPSAAAPPAGGAGAAAPGGAAGVPAGPAAAAAAEAAAARAAGAPAPAPRLAGTTIQKLAIVLRKGVTLRCEADAGTVCALSATVSAADARRLKLAPKGAKKPVVVGTVRAVAVAGGSDVVLRLSARAASRLRRASQIVLLVRGTAVLGSRRATVQRAVLVRR